MNLYMIIIIIVVFDISFCQNKLGLEGGNLFGDSSTSYRLINQSSLSIEYLEVDLWKESFDTTTDLHLLQYSRKTHV